MHVGGRGKKPRVLQPEFLKTLKSVSTLMWEWPCLIFCKLESFIMAYIGWCVCVCACACARARACVRACVCVCVCVRACVVHHSGMRHRQCLPLIVWSVFSWWPVHRDTCHHSLCPLLLWGGCSGNYTDNWEREGGREIVQDQGEGGNNNYVERG